jgi:sirohydrochlorin ferrochelatase
VAPALLAVAHGSRDPRSAQTMTALMDVVAAARPDLDVRLSFLDLATPTLGQQLAVLNQQGAHEIVVVPLLLGRAFHADVDVPEAVAQARTDHHGLHVSVADVLGADPRIVGAMLDRLGEAGADLADPELGVVLTAVGSSRAAANRALHQVAATLPVPRSAVAFATTKPSVADAVAQLRRRGAHRVAVGSWFLAPGLLPDQVGRDVAGCAPGSVVAPAIGAHPAVAQVVLDRYDAALARQAVPDFAPAH